MVEVARHTIHETEVGAMENGVEKKYTFSKEPYSTFSLAAGSVVVV